jgi:two-component system sensor histidine kinase KdpD
MREAEQLKSDFLSLVSHELNTPITTIIGAAHLLQSGASTLTDLDRHELLSDLVAESDRLAKMLSNLITVTAVYAGTIQAQTEPVLIEHVVQRAIDSARRRGRDRVFFNDVPRGLPPVEADPGLLDHVLSNVLDNSIKYGQPGGKTRIRAELAGTDLVVAIDDDGPGLDSERISRIFDRFYRADETSQAHGLGLGLYLCRFLMSAQSGSIEASSAGLGLGMTISLRLPIAGGWADDGGERTEL